jgi:hypothetical protein
LLASKLKSTFIQIEDKNVLIRHDGAIFLGGGIIGPRV